MKPTKKNISETLNVDISVASNIQGLISGRLDPEDFEAGAARIRECYNRPSEIDLVLTVINSLLDMYGVEYIRPTYDENFSDITGIEYCNSGDTYNPTVCYDHGKNKFLVCCWGDIVETDKRFQIED